MIHLAKALIVIGDSRAAETLSRTLSAQGYTCTHTDTGAEVDALIISHAPDVLIIGPDLKGEHQKDLAARLKSSPATKGLPLFYLSAEPLEQTGDSLLDLGIDDAVIWPVHPDLVLARLRPLARVATMRTEYLARRAVMDAENLSPEAPDAAETATPPSILVIGPEETSETVTQAIADAQVMVAADLVEAQRLMDERLFDAAVMAPAGNPQPYLDLCLQVRRNVRLFNLPVVFISGDGSADDLATAMSMGASSALRADAGITELRFTLRVLVRRQRLRWALRRSLGSQLTPATVDPVIPGVYSLPFLDLCLTARLSGAETRVRRFSVIEFAFAGVESIRHEFGEESERSLISQIGQWLTLLVRAEDMVASLGGSRFAVVLPDTPLSEAQVVMHRIAGVISNTEFAAKDVYRVVTVWPFVNAAEVVAGDTPESLLARAAAVVGEGLAPW